MRDGLGRDDTSTWSSAVTAHPIFDVAGKTALVTGSSRGIGLALARGLLSAGVTVVLNARDPEQLRRAKVALQSVANECNAIVHTVGFDVTNPAAVVDGITEVEDIAGPLDILVNNTGAQHRTTFIDFSDADWYRLLDTNLSSAFLVGREVARRMVDRQSGKIVNICSLQSEVARPGIAAYSATKGALKMLTKGMSADLAPHGINVNAIGPGYFATELTAALVADEQFSQWVAGRTPAGRWGDVQDLVGGLLFLVSPAADFVQGHILYIDGGMLAVL
jgi:gluconate 5-dehydrogenase